MSELYDVIEVEGHTYYRPKAHPAARQLSLTDVGLDVERLDQENWHTDPETWLNEKVHLMATQPAPMPNKEVHVVDWVISDLRDRKAMGIEKYGTALQPFNGRRALVDLYEELLDAVLYLRQHLLEEEAK